MIERLIQKEVQEFITTHEQDDGQKLLLKHKTIFDLPASLIVNQIIGRRKVREKVPLYYNHQGIVYPPALNLAQSSSEKTASFKAGILPNIVPSKNTALDLTGGFGIDSFFLSKVFKQVKYVEPNDELLPYARHNHKALGAKNILHYNSTAQTFLKSNTEKVDCIFIDPSRRNNSNQKVFKLADCEPDVTALLPQIFKVSSLLLIKTSPLLDIQQGIKELGFVQQVWVVSVDNECKELLFLCTPNVNGEPVITAVNLGEDSKEFSFSVPDEQNASAKFSGPLTYLYEPNASILKAGAFKLVAEKFSLFKLHPSTHLYTSDLLVRNFPGRIFKTDQFVKVDSKSVASSFPEGKANVITRNFPLSAEALKKKLKLKDGGDRYLLGFSGQEKKFLVSAHRLK